MPKRVIATASAPAAIGPYSQAIAADGWLFVSGCIALDPASGQMQGELVEAQTRRALDNLKAILAAAGTTLEHVVKTTVFVADMNDFAAVNKVYAEYFHANPPARSTVQAARLPKDALVEIDAIAKL